MFNCSRNYIGEKSLDFMTKYLWVRRIITCRTTVVDNFVYIAFLFFTINF